MAAINTELMQKRLEPLSELVPQVRAIALLVNPNNAIAERIMRDTAQAARVKGVQLPILKAATEGEIDAAFSTLVQLHAGALVIATDGFLVSRHEQLVALASRMLFRRSNPWREAVDGGGLIGRNVSLPLLATRRGFLVATFLLLHMLTAEIGST